MEGYVKIYRKMLDDKLICLDTEYWAVWCYLLLSATHKPYKSIFNGKEIILQPRTTYNWKGLYSQ